MNISHASAMTQGPHAALIASFQHAPVVAARPEILKVAATGTAEAMRGPRVLDTQRALILEAMFEDFGPDAGRPVGHVDRPVGELDLPVGSQNRPVGEPDLPVGHQNRPVGELNLPVGELDAPIGRQNRPVGEPDLPVGAIDGPVGRQNRPVGELDLPVGEQNVPIGAEDGPAILSANRGIARQRADMQYAAELFEARVLELRDQAAGRGPAFDLRA